MTRPRPRIGSELLPLFLILLCLGGTLALVLQMYRRGAAARRIEEPPKVAAAPAPPPAPRPDPVPVAAPPPPPVHEDPTQKTLGQLRAAEEVERAEAAKAERRAESLDLARRSALAESQRWRRRETIVRTQIADLADKAENLERALEALALERDALARERDAAKAALAKARRSSSYAILPHKGPNGTWRRPIVIECRNGNAILQPEGAAFSLLDLAGFRGLRSSPFVTAVAKELVRIGASATPDGGINVPYIFFVIRPDGIRPYYEARARLQMLGITFGYELVEQNWEIDYAALENPIDGDSRLPARSTPQPALAEREELGWPGEPPKAKGASAESPEKFVWRSTPTGAADRPLGGTLSRGAGSSRPSAPVPDVGSPPRRGVGELAGSGFGRDGIAPGGAGAQDGSEDTGASGGGPRAGRNRTPVVPLGVADGQSATDRAFGAPGGITPMSPTGLPSFEPTGGASERLLAQNDVPPRGRANVGTSGPEGAAGAPMLGALEEDDVPQDGRVPVIPRSYFDEKDEQAAAKAAAGAERTNEAAGSTGGAAGKGTGSGSGGGQGASGASPPAPGAQGAGASGTGASAGGVQTTNGAGEGAGEERAIKRPPSRNETPPLRIEVPFEMTVVCSRDGVVIHPGGYRLSPGSLKGKGDVLIKELNAVLQRRREVDPMIVPRPRLKFLIESGGAGTYEIARRQTSLAGLSWPTTIQIGETSVITFSGQEGRR